MNISDIRIITFISKDYKYIYKSYEKNLCVCFQICKGGVDKSPSDTQYFYHKLSLFMAFEASLP